MRCVSKLLPSTYRSLGCSTARVVQAIHKRTATGGMNYGPGKAARLNATLYSRTYPVIVMDEHGVVSKERVSISEIIQRTGMHARDLVSLNMENEPFMLTMQSHFLVRENAVLVNVGYMRVIFERNTCIVFRPAAPLVRTAIESLSDTLGERNVAHSIQPFEIVLLEAILREVVDTYYRRVQICKPLVESFIKQISDMPVENAALRQLLPLKDGLASLDDNTSHVLDALIAVLKSNEAMANMQLTRKHELALIGQHLPMEEHGAIELLLESYHRKFSVIRRQIRALQRQLQNTQEMASFSIDMYRNKLISMEIQLTIASVSLGFASTITGFFGMNLLSGLEAHYSAFWMICGTTSIASAVVWAVSMYRLQSIRHQTFQQNTHNNLQSMHWVTQNIHVIEHAIRSHWNKTNNERNLNKLSITREDLSIALSNSSQTKVGGAEVDLLMNILGVTRDTRFQPQQLLRKLFPAMQESSEHEEESPKK